MKLQQWNNRKVVAALVVVISAMTGLVAYSPTLYRIFCAATGYGGTTQRVASSDGGAMSDRLVTVRFDTNVAQDMPWRFEPEQSEVKVRLGEQKLVFFSAENLSDQPIVGHATFNVSPPATGLYFKKIQCFCFNEERLEARQKVDMPVVFFVDPALATDPTTADVGSITLSYTFYRSLAPEKGKDLARLAVASNPDPDQGRRLFMDRCSACHSLGANRAGPTLGGVFGRQAGSAPGYSYSPALRNSGVVWSAETLDHWLSGPGQFVPGARMPVRVEDPSIRRDIIAFLQAESGKRGEAAGRTSIAQQPAAHANE